jgi:hypothetical protein
LGDKFYFSCRCHLLEQIESKAWVGLKHGFIISKLQLKVNQFLFADGFLPILSCEVSFEYKI